MNTKQDPDPESALLVTGIPYVCRVCTAETTVYTEVEMADDGPEVDLSSKRLWHGYCESCDQERPHVVRFPEGDAS